MTTIATELDAIYASIAEHEREIDTLLRRARELEDEHDTPREIAADAAFDRAKEDRAERSGDEETKRMRESE